MKILVINMQDDVGRRTSIEQQLRGLSLSYELLPAVVGRALSNEERLAHYNEKRCVRTFGRPLTRPELGCALSHVSAYRKVLEQDLPWALILEDDAWLNPTLAQLMTAVEQSYSSRDRNVFLFGWAEQVEAGKYRRLWSGYGVIPARSAIGAHAYALSNAAARALLTVLYPVRHVADCWRWLRRHRVVNLYAVVPPCIGLDLSNESTMEPPPPEWSGRGSLLGRLKYKARRAWWEIADRLSALR